MSIVFLLVCKKKNMHSREDSWVEDCMDSLVSLKYCKRKAPKINSRWDQRGPTHSDCFHQKKSMFYTEKECLREESSPCACFNYIANIRKINSKVLITKTMLNCPKKEKKKVMK